MFAKRRGSTSWFGSAPWQFVASGAALVLAFVGEASAQVRPMPAPSVYGGGSSDLFPFVVGALFFFALLTVLIGVVLLPLLARSLGGRIDEGRAWWISVPLAIIALVVLWRPLHLTEASVWVTVAGLGLVVVGVVGAIGSAIFRNREGALYVGVTAVATIVFYVKTSWGFWLSLLAGFGVLLLGAGLYDVLGWAASASLPACGRLASRLGARKALSGDPATTGGEAKDTSHGIGVKRR